MTEAAHQLITDLVARGDTLATAESLTGGQLAAMLTSIPGASGCFVGGVVSYATSVKVSLLGVSEAIVAEHGVVSAACAAAMATGVRDLLATTYALATTGVAGPESQDGKPVGHVWVAAAGPRGVQTRLLSLNGDRATIQQGSCHGAMSVLGAMLRDVDSGLG